MSLSNNTQLSSLPIGIFDSGIGGLSIAKCIKKTLPNESLIYIADNLHAPYGEKSDAFISQRVVTLGHYLTEHPVKALVVACNTATVTAINTLRAQVKIPIIGVEPAIKPAALKSKNKKVGILVTAATAANTHFNQLVQTHANNANVYIQPCPGLVEAIEKTGENTPAIMALLKQYLKEFINEGIDTLVLGCTHYPLIKQHIEQLLPKSVYIIDTAQAVTAQLQRKLVEYKVSESKEGEAIPDIFYTTACNIAMTKKMSEIWQQPVQVLPLSI